MHKTLQGDLGWTTGTFNSNGFTLPSDTNGSINGSHDYVSWTFRDAPKFFDSVTYNSSSGNVTNFGSAGATVDHSLGSVPGLIIVKCIDTASTSWKVYHRSLNGGTNPEEYEIELNANGAQTNSASSWYDTAPTSTQFTLGSSGDVNNSSRSYTAYLFAHNDNGDGGFGAAADQDIIKCGSYTGNGSSTGPEIDLGFEPQWVLIKCATTGGANYGWYTMDVMRGMHGGDDTWIDVSSSAAESAATYDYVKPEPTGFKLQSADSQVNQSSQTYIYVAIRRGPLAAPTAATEVFEATAYTGNNTANRTVGSLTVDMNIIMDRNKSAEDNNILFDRMRGQDLALKIDQTAAEGGGWGGIYYNLDQQNGFSNGSNTSYFNNSSGDYISYIWKRAPNFFDVVGPYVGNSTAGRTVSHNLTVAPEMMWVKQASAAQSWYAYHKDPRE